MNRVTQAPTNVDDTTRSRYFTTGLSRVFEYLEPPTAVVKHLRHERQTIEPPFVIQCRKDFLFAPNFDPISCP
jgi:hypothetical protein